jgi:hypothetical protein
MYAAHEVGGSRKATVTEHSEDGQFAWIYRVDVRRMARECVRDINITA